MMQTTATSSGEIAILRPTGRLDSHSLEGLANQIDQSPKYLVVNLNAVTFLDSSALGVLVRGMKRCRQMGGDLYLCEIQAPVRLIFELTRLNKAFDIFALENDALVAMTNGHMI